MKPEQFINDIPTSLYNESASGASAMTSELQNPNVKHYVRFAKDAVQLGKMLEVAGAVGIAADPITDPEVAGEAYAAQAHEELARGLIYAEDQSKPNPVWFREVAKKRVASGETMMRFTVATGLQEMTLFIDEYNRRFGFDEKK